MKPLVTMREALADPALFGTILAGDTWAAWRVVLIAAMGEPLTSDERALFEALTGRPQEPGEMVEELWAIVGRRGGKTRAIAVLGAYLAALCDHASVLAPGEATGAEHRLAGIAEEVGRKVEAVVLEVSGGLAASIDAIEARALEMRVALEGVSEHWRMDGGKMVPIRTDDSVRRILETNALTPIGTLNTQLNRRAKASRGRWEEFITALGVDARAEF